MGEVIVRISVERLYVRSGGQTWEMERYSGRGYGGCKYGTVICGERGSKQGNRTVWLERLLQGLVWN